MLSSDGGPSSRPAAAPDDDGLGAGRPPLLDLRNQLDDKAVAKDALPQFVHQVAGQLEDVGRHVLQTAAVLGDDGQDALIAQQHHTGRQVLHDDGKEFRMELAVLGV